MAETWAEVGSFKAMLRAPRKAKKEIWRRPKPGDEGETESFSVYLGDYFTTRRGYRDPLDLLQREKSSIPRAPTRAPVLMRLNAKINTRHLKEKQAIETAVIDRVDKHRVRPFFHFEIGALHEQYSVQVGKGRPGKNTNYETHSRTLFTLTWTRKTQALKEEANTDGVFPLLSTDTGLSAKDVLRSLSSP